MLGGALETPAARKDIALEFVGISLTRQQAANYRRPRLKTGLSALKTDPVTQSICAIFCQLKRQWSSICANLRKALLRPWLGATMGHCSVTVDQIARETAVSRDYTLTRRGWGHVRGSSIPGWPQCRSTSSNRREPTINVVS